MIPYPGLTMFALIGPNETLREHTDLHLLGSTTDEFFSDSGAPFGQQNCLLVLVEWLQAGWRSPFIHRQ